MSSESYGNPSRDEEDFDFLDDVGTAPEPAVPDNTTEFAGGTRVVRRRKRDRKSRRYNKKDYVQISGVVSRSVKAEFDIALAREKVETGRGRKQFEVLESLMRFYSEEGDPYELLEDE